LIIAVTAAKDFWFTVPTSFLENLLHGIDGVRLAVARRPSGRGGGRLVAPAVLVEECRRVAPRPIVGLGDVALKPGHDVGEGSALESCRKFPFGVPLADLVRKQAPECVEVPARLG
jgi:hypothetical protein